MGFQPSNHGSRGGQGRFQHRDQLSDQERYAAAIAEDAGTRPASSGPARRRWGYQDHAAPWIALARDMPLQIFRKASWRVLARFLPMLCQNHP